MSGGEFQLIRVEEQQDGAALRVMLSAPKGNILSMAMMAELSAALRAHKDDAALRMVLLCAEGKNFSFGASVEEHRREQAPSMLSAFHAFIREVAAYPVPIVSLVNGACLGGAFELVLATHVVFTTDTAHFACPEIQLGVFPPVLAVLGPQRLGGALSERLLLTGASLSAKEAQAAGFVAQVFDAEDAEAAVWGWFAEHLQPRSAYALRQATRASRLGSGLCALLDTALLEVEQLYLDEVLPSFDGNEGIEAFIARRKPSWEHR